MKRESIETKKDNELALSGVPIDEFRTSSGDSTSQRGFVNYNDQKMVSFGLRNCQVHLPSMDYFSRSKKDVRSFEKSSRSRSLKQREESDIHFPLTERSKYPESPKMKDNEDKTTVSVSRFKLFKERQEESIFQKEFPLIRDSKSEEMLLSYFKETKRIAKMKKERLHEEKSKRDFGKSHAELFLTRRNQDHPFETMRWLTEEGVSFISDARSLMKGRKPVEKDLSVLRQTIETDKKPRRESPFGTDCLPRNMILPKNEEEIYEILNKNEFPFPKIDSMNAGNANQVLAGLGKQKPFEKVKKNNAKPNTISWRRITKQNDKMPTGRKEVMDLSNWFSSVKEKGLHDESHREIKRQIAVHSFAMLEIIRQSKVAFSERGELLQNIWSSFVGLFQEVIAQIEPVIEQFGKAMRMKTQEIQTQFEEKQRKLEELMKTRQRDLGTCWEIIHHLERQLKAETSRLNHSFYKIKTQKTELDRLKEAEIINERTIQKLRVFIEEFKAKLVESSGLEGSQSALSSLKEAFEKKEKRLEKHLADLELIDRVEVRASQSKLKFQEDFEAELSKEAEFFNNSKTITELRKIQSSIVFDNDDKLNSSIGVPSGDITSFYERHELVDKMTSTRDELPTNSKATDTHQDSALFFQDSFSETDDLIILSTVASQTGFIKPTHKGTQCNMSPVPLGWEQADRASSHSSSESIKSNSSDRIRENSSSSLVGENSENNNGNGNFVTFTSRLKKFTSIVIEESEESLESDAVIEGSRRMISQEAILTPSSDFPMKASEKAKQLQESLRALNESSSPMGSFSNFTNIQMNKDKKIKFLEKQVENYRNFTQFAQKEIGGLADRLANMENIEESLKIELTEKNLDFKKVQTDMKKQEMIYQKALNMFENEEEDQRKNKEKSQKEKRNSEFVVKVEKEQSERKSETESLESSSNRSMMSIKSINLLDVVERDRRVSITHSSTGIRNNTNTLQVPFQGSEKLPKKSKEMRRISSQISFTSLNIENTTKRRKKSQTSIVSDVAKMESDRKMRTREKTMLHYTKKYNSQAAEAADIVSEFTRDNLSSKATKSVLHTKLMSKKTLLSLISSIYKDYIEKIGFGTHEMFVAAYKFLIDKYAIDSTVKKKYREILKSAQYYSSDKRIRTFCGFIGLSCIFDQEILANFTLLIKTYIDHNIDIFHKMSLLGGFLVPLNFTIEACKRIFKDYDVQVFEKLKEKLEKAKVSDGRTKAPLFVDFDETVDILLSHFSHNKHLGNPSDEVFFAADINGDGILEYEEFVRITRHCEPDFFQENKFRLSQLFEEYSQEQVGEKTMSLGLFRKICKDKGLYSKKSKETLVSNFKEGFAENLAELLELWEPIKTSLKKALMLCRAYCFEFKHLIEKLDKHIKNFEESFADKIWFNYAILEKEVARLYENNKIKGLIAEEFFSFLI